ncbi:hypothetical protein B7494_g6925 [Chlorociboria aeruginascens]|nr:hypothetical protein B7494_g6925 [Chlorociboria aeruginascens]
MSTNKIYTNDMSRPEIDEEGMGPAERGRGRYQRKDYTGALEAFTTAVNMSTGHLLLTALDHRAATYEKLEQLQPALRDAKQMIDLMPELSKGYLRCAKILQLKREQDLALKIYERGLRKVKIGADNDRTKLEAMFRKLQEKQAPRKSLDPLEYLPLELAEMVCQNLEIRDRVICLAVNSSWKRLLESSHKLWTTLDMTSTRRKVSLHSLKKHLRRSNYTVDRAMISLKAGFDSVKMQYLIRTCKSLRHLEIHGQGIVGDSLTSALPLARNLETILVSKNTKISLVSVEQALKAVHTTIADASFLNVLCRPNEMARLKQWPMIQSLKTLNLRSSSCEALDTLDVYAIAPNLTSLLISGWTVPGNRSMTKWQELSHLQLNGTRLSQMPLLPPTLKHLDVSNNYNFDSLIYYDQQSDEVGLDGTKSQSHTFPLLETFNCSSTQINSQAIKAITKHSIEAGNLKKLWIGNRLVDDSNKPVEDVYPSSDSVEELSLAKTQIKEKRIIQIVGLYPNLRKLDVSGTKITGVAIKIFASMGIKCLILIECAEIGSDAIEYARSKDIEVHFGFPSRSGRIAFSTGFAVSFM